MDPIQCTNILLLLDKQNPKCDGVKAICQHGDRRVDFILINRQTCKNTGTPLQAGTSQWQHKINRFKTNSVSKTRRSRSLTLTRQPREQSEVSSCRSLNYTYLQTVHIYSTAVWTEGVSFSTWNNWLSCRFTSVTPNMVLTLGQNSRLVQFKASFYKCWKKNFFKHTRCQISQNKNLVSDITSCLGSHLDVRATSTRQTLPWNENPSAKNVLNSKIYIIYTLP